MKLGNKHDVARFLNGVTEKQVAHGIQKLWAIDSVTQSAFAVKKTINADHSWFVLADGPDLFSNACAGKMTDIYNQDPFVFNGIGADV